MLGNLLEKKLRDQKGKTIIAVMNDNMAFMGKLVEFDKDTLVLREVFQASAKDIVWDDMSADASGGDKTCTVPGCIEWTDVDLEEVYIQLEHVSRIWPRDISEDGNEKVSRKDVIYRREGKAGANRALGLDVPGEMK